MYTFSVDMVLEQSTHNLTFRTSNNCPNNYKNMNHLSYTIIFIRLLEDNEYEHFVLQNVYV